MGPFIKTLDGFWDTGVSAIILCGGTIGYLCWYHFRLRKQAPLQSWVKPFLLFLLFSALWRIGYGTTSARYWIFCTIITTATGCALLAAPFGTSYSKNRYIRGTIVLCLTMVSLGLAGNIFFRPSRKDGLFQAIKIVRKEMQGTKNPHIIAAHKDALRMRWYGNWLDSQFQVTTPSALWKELNEAVRQYDLLVICYRRKDFQSFPQSSEIKDFLRQSGVENAEISFQSIEVLPKHILEFLTIKNSQASFFGIPIISQAPVSETVVLSEDFNSHNTLITLPLQVQGKTQQYRMPFPDSLRLRIPDQGISSSDQVNIRLRSTTGAENYLEIAAGALSVAGKNNLPARKYYVQVCFSGEIGQQLLLTVYPVGPKKPCNARTFHLATVMSENFRERRVYLPDFQDDCQEIWLSFHSPGKVKLKKLVVSQDPSSQVSRNIELK